MKKKLLFVLLLPLFLVLVVGCDKKEVAKSDDDITKVESKNETIELFDEKMGVKTTFEYDPSIKFTNLKEESGGASKSITFENENLDVSFQMYYNKMQVAAYNKSKQSRSDDKNYKEYKFRNYDGYAYGDYDDGVYLNILLNVDDEDYADVLFVSIDRLDTNKDVVVSKLLDDTVLQDFFNTMSVELSK